MPKHFLTFMSSPNSAHPESTMLMVLTWPTMLYVSGPTFLMSRNVDTDTSKPQQPLKTITAAADTSKRVDIHSESVSCGVSGTRNTKPSRGEQAANSTTQMGV